MKTAKNYHLDEFKTNIPYSYYFATIRNLLIVLLVLLLIGCSPGFINKKVNLEETPTASVIEKHKSKKYAILHTGTQKIHLYSITVDQENQQLSALYTDVGPAHTNYEPLLTTTSRTYKRKLGDPVHEIHILTKKSLNLEGTEKLIIPFSSIDNIVVYNPDTGKIVMNTVLITAGVAVGILAIIAATKSSCPFVYTNNGEIFTFEGELYPGATTPNTERDDYMKLPQLTTKDSVYTIRVSNELKEIQYTNLLELIEVQHPENKEVFIDQYGKVYGIKDPQSPNDLIINSVREIPTVLQKKDNVSYLFNATTSDENDMQAIELTFDKPSDNNRANLVLNLKNAYWLDYAMGEFHHKFGSYFSTFQQKQIETPGDKTMKWIEDQGIPLAIYLKKNNTWKLIELINTVGPLAFRDVVVPIDLTGIKQQQIEIKLACGFMFWELDYAALDTNKTPINMEVRYINPTRATTQNGEDVTTLITSTDSDYFVQPEIGDVATIEFKNNSPLKKGYKKTVFLKNRGYYRYLRDFTEEPDFTYLKTFRKKGAFMHFSKNLYYDFSTKEHVMDAVVKN